MLRTRACSRIIIAHSELKNHFATVSANSRHPDEQGAPFTYNGDNVVDYRLARIEEGKMKTNEDAIVAEIEAFSAAWNKGDAKLTASFFTENGVRVGAMGDRQQGRTELEAAYHKLLHGPFAGATVRQERGSVRMLTPDLAVWQGGLEILPNGGAPMRGHVVQVMKKVNGRWLVLEAHPKLFPPPPRA